ncbi:succinic semialdehyde dehydrogenase [Blastococcus goldschmidtiae]|uniref:Succinic semialdehyde dehydrogenase n=1 Tax=Blastococcus goldschmidtiae TaxID=3075546 RepID=A0ABU2K9F3_9ACTN|nr:succinic semialdehyde dehydrogenase [Blastococcus sp. DSM 46792]MDT0276819.1 succinic semialdehyde dehydrogenase [Blastococcus sp. DSM 46792]
MTTTAPHPSPALDPELVSRLSALVTAAPGRPRQASHAPFTGALIGEVPTCTAEDVAEAQRRARPAQVAWAARPLAERRAVMLRYHDLVLERQEQILDITQVETGKNRIAAFEELADVAMTARYYANTAAKHLRPTRRQGALPVLTRTVEHHHPKGLVGVISPWNYPLTLAVSDAIPALLAGNGIVLKPDAQTPFTALIAVELLFEAGLPRDLLQVVTGAGKVLGTPLIEGVEYLMFTGSTATGRIVAEQCARRLIGFSAELGGKNPMIVLADADLDKAVEGAIRACFSNSGQLCISVERMYVEDPIYDRFVPAFAERVQRMTLGAGLDWDADMGSLVSSDQLDVVTRHVDDAVTKGARVLAGGKPRPELGPLFYEPTVLEGVTDEMELARDETFGPVVAVTRVADADEAVRRANDTDYGLNASIWTSPRRGAELATRVQAGTVNVNEGYAAAWASHDAPMGGMKDSGVGRRHGREGILKYTESQTVAVQRGMPIGPMPGQPLEKYASVMTTGLKLLKRVPFLK